jgi:predicted nucleotidyltransferase
MIAYMNTTVAALSPLFRSDAQAEILARVLLNPDRGYTTAELSRLTGTAYATAHREVRRLVEFGLFRAEQVGRAVRVAANPDNRAYEPAVALLRPSYGPAAVLPRFLAGIAGVEEAYVYGSWAARRTGEPGTGPGDIDVLVIGDPPRAAIHEAAAAAERELGREVNVRVISRCAWDDGDDLFVRTVRERPLVRLDLEEQP